MPTNSFFCNAFSQEGILLDKKIHMHKEGGTAQIQRHIHTHMYIPTTKIVKERKKELIRVF